MPASIQLLDLWKSRMRTLLMLCISIACLNNYVAEGAELTKGFQPQVQVGQPTRLDWTFALSNQSLAEPPADWLKQGGLKDYDSTKQSYQLFIPNSYRVGKPLPLILFFSASDKPSGWTAWKQTCESQGVAFAGLVDAGNNCPTPRRIRIALDVLDDVRRKCPIDADRTYTSGFSGGGRMACLLAFSLPELFGGTVPLCASGDLREEPWRQQRVMDRLSVALMTGENDFNRGEVQRYRGPLLEGLGVRTKVWVTPGLGHGQPPPAALLEAYRWLEEGAASRQRLAKLYPASQLTGQQALTRQEAAAQLLAEARERIKKPETLHSGLMQLMGVRVRWADLPASAEATKILLEFDARPDHPWEADDIALQRRTLIAQARATDSYADGPFPKQYAAERPQVIQAALNLWQQVLADGQDAKAVEQAKQRIPILEKMQAE